MHHRTIRGVAHGNLTAKIRAGCVLGHDTPGRLVDHEVFRAVQNSGLDTHDMQNPRRAISGATTLTEVDQATAGVWIFCAETRAERQCHGKRLAHTYQVNDAAMSSVIMPAIVPNGKARAGERTSSAA